MACMCENCKKYPKDELLEEKICAAAGCSDIFHPTIMNPKRVFCDVHIKMDPSDIKIAGPDVDDSKYGGLPIDDPKYPPKQCQDCGTWFQPSKFTWNYAKRCSECRKPKGNKLGLGAKTKQVPCAECDEMLEVGIFAANTQYCDKCRENKGITKKGKKVPLPKKDFSGDPIKKVERFASDVDNTKSKMLSVGDNGDHDQDTIKFYAAIGQLESERLILSGVIDRERKDSVKEDIFLYLIPRGFKVSRNLLWKRYDNQEYISLIFVRNKLHHITYKFEKPNRESSKLIATKENYDKLSEQIKDDIDLIVTLTGVLKETSPLTDEYIAIVKKTYNPKFADMEI